MKKRGPGRPSKYPSIDQVKVKKYYRLGLIDKEVADLLDISEDSLANYKKQYPKFFESIKLTKAKYDAEVEKALLDSCKGFEHPEEALFQHNGRLIRAETRKKYPPNATSLIFWLKNRRPELWKDRHEIDNKSSDGSMTPVDSIVLTKEQAKLIREIRRGQSAGAARVRTAQQ